MSKYHEKDMLDTLEHHFKDIDCHPLPENKDLLSFLGDEVELTQETAEAVAKKFMHNGATCNMSMPTMCSDLRRLAADKHEVEIPPHSTLSCGRCSCH